jgi:hypothetical protein
MRLVQPRFHAARHRRQAAALLPAHLPPRLRRGRPLLGGRGGRRREADRRCAPQWRCRNARVAPRGSLAGAGSRGSALRQRDRLASVRRDDRHANTGRPVPSRRPSARLRASSGPCAPTPAIRGIRRRPAIGPLPTFAPEFYTPEPVELSGRGQRSEIPELRKNSFAGRPFSVDDARPGTRIGLSWSRILGTPQRGRRAPSGRRGTAGGPGTS